MDEKAALRAEVDALQLKLHELHATDVNTFRRSYASIAQHVEALKVEASRLEALVHEVEPDVYSAEFLAEEFGKAAVVGGAGWVLYKLVKSIPPLPVKARNWLGGSLVVATAVVISWRFASSSIGRFASAFFDHRRRKKAFLREVAELQHRIDILLALTTSLPGVLSQPKLTALAAADTPAGAAGAAGPAALSSAGSGSGSGNGGNGGREQFVVVDLPRVESGGFVLPSPVPSPPPAVLAAGLPPVPPSSAATAGTGAPAAAGGSVRGAAAGVGSGSAAAATATEAAAGPFAAPAQQRLASAAAVADAASVHKPAAARLTAVQEGRAADAAEPQQPVVQQQTQPWEGEVPEASMVTRGGSGYEIPDSVMKAGWGGVLQQQQQQQRPQQPWQPPTTLPQVQRTAGPTGPQHPAQQSWAQQQQQQQQQQQASPASRQWSSGMDLGDEGEFVEQPSDVEEQASSSKRTAGQLLAGGAAASSGGIEQKSAGSHAHSSGLQRGSPASSSDDDAVLLERE